MLGVPRSASQAEIKQAFRRKAVEHHPDKCATLPAIVAVALPKVPVSVLIGIRCAGTYHMAQGRRQAAHSSSRPSPKHTTHLAQVLSPLEHFPNFADVGLRALEHWRACAAAEVKRKAYDSSLSYGGGGSTSRSQQHQRHQGYQHPYYSSSARRSAYPHTHSQTYARRSTHLPSAHARPRHWGMGAIMRITLTATRNVQASGAYLRCACAA